VFESGRQGRAVAGGSVCSAFPGPCLDDCNGTVGTPFPVVGLRCCGNSVCAEMNLLKCWYDQCIPRPMAGAFVVDIRWSSNWATTSDGIDSHKPPSSRPFPPSTLISCQSFNIDSPSPLFNFHGFSSLPHFPRNLSSKSSLPAQTVPISCLPISQTFSSHNHLSFNSYSSSNFLHEPPFRPPSGVPLSSSIISYPIPTFNPQHHKQPSLIPICSQTRLPIHMGIPQ
jgi:hypothetical protein